MVHKTKGSLHPPAIVFGNVIIHIMRPVLADRGRLAVCWGGIHDHVLVILASRCSCGRRDRERWVGNPCKLDLTHGRDRPGSKHELLGLVSLLEGDHHGVRLAGVRLNGFVLADALMTEVSRRFFLGPSSVTHNQVLSQGFILVRVELDACDSHSPWPVVQAQHATPATGSGPASPTISTAV